MSNRSLDLDPYFCPRIEFRPKLDVGTFAENGFVYECKIIESQL